MSEIISLDNIKTNYLNKIKGREKIIAKGTYTDFNEDTIKFLTENLAYGYNKHKRNVLEMKKLLEEYRGNQDILLKVRVDESPINNIVVVNNRFRLVEFKKGFMVGKPIDYAINNSNVSNDDMSIINKHLIACKKAQLDIDKYEDIYLYGIAHQFLIPKTYDYDYESEAPYELYNVDNGECFCVYSSDFTRTKIFGVILTKKKVANRDRVIFNVYMKERYIECYYSSNKILTILSDKKQPYNYVPIIEYTLNKSRLNVFEPVDLLLDFINKLVSMQGDDIENFTNSFLVFLNQKIDEKFFENLKKLKKQRTLAVSTNDPQKPADIKLLQQSLDHSQVNELYDKLVKAIYDITATPQGSGNVTSGGDTGQARLLGNGWENAQNQAEVDTNYISTFERELLENIISIEKSVKDSKVDKISASDITIKYNINMSNNLLVKTQALMNLDNINFPKKNSLAVVGLTNDVDGVGNLWEKNVEEKQETNVENVENIVEQKI